MKIPFLDLRKVNAELDLEVKNAIHHVLESGWYILGHSGEAFEKNCKHSLVGDRDGYVVGCNSGTDALILSLLAIGAGPDDEVITVSHTAIPTICAINAVGAKPVFVDIDPATWVMDIGRVQAAMTSKTKAIIPVHIYGNMADMLALQELLLRAGRENISIIEDVAQAQGSAFVNEQAGTFGRFGAFSFYPSKNIGALGDGGAVLCHTASDRDVLKSLRYYGQSDRYHAELRRGMNSRLDEIQAVILDIKLKYLDEWNRRKTVLMDRYREELSGLPVKFQEITRGCKPAWHLCVIALENKEIRDKLAAHLSNNGIQTMIHYPIPTHRQKAFFSKTSSLPVTEDLASRILSLPFNIAMTGEEIAWMTRHIRSFFT